MAIDKAYTEPEQLPSDELVVNDDLAKAYLKALESLKRANDKLKAIENLQPVEEKP